MALFKRGNDAAKKKMTRELVEELRQYYAGGATQGDLARHYGISVIQVGRIVRGESWQDDAGARGQTQAEKDAMLARLLATQRAATGMPASPLEGGEGDVSLPRMPVSEELQKTARALGLDVEALYQEGKKHEQQG